jgi:acyl-coenzyme A synthetase/AMP-(fatty) acid ligase
MVNIARELSAARKEYRDKTAIVDVDETKYTYEDLDKLSNRVANLLSEGYGVKTDDIVTGILRDNAWAVAFMFGVMKTGAAFTLENFTLQEDVIVDNVDRVERRSSW